MARRKSKKQKLEKEEEPKKPKTKPINNKNKKKKKAAPSDSDSDSSDLDTNIQKVLEPYSKEKLIDFLAEAALFDPSLLTLLRSAADRDVSHRKIFIHGFAYDTTRETLNSTFDSYGEIEDCNVVTDKATGRAKGYGFVLFKTRAAAAKALKQPQKRMGSRTAFCQLASVGPAGATAQAAGGASDSAGRKIYVSNVGPVADADRLRAFFGRFGEIETGPLGFDQVTGKSRGYALFVYKTVEGARKALEEPHKVFEGQQLHCQLAASDPAALQKATVPGGGPQLPPGPAALAAAAAAQNLALFTQNPVLNPAFNALVGNSAASGLMSGSGLGGGYGSGLGGLGSGSQSVLGPYGMQGQAKGSAQNAYPGQSSSSRAFAGGLLSGIPPYML